MDGTRATRQGSTNKSTKKGDAAGELDGVCFAVLTYWGMVICIPSYARSTRSTSPSFNSPNAT
jgi:hypothetical protein